MALDGRDESRQLHSRAHRMGALVAAHQPVHRMALIAGGHTDHETPRIDAPYLDVGKERSQDPNGAEAESPPRARDRALRTHHTHRGRSQKPESGPRSERPTARPGHIAPPIARLPAGRPTPPRGCPTGANTKCVITSAAATHRSQPRVCEASLRQRPTAPNTPMPTNTKSRLLGNAAATGTAASTDPVSNHALTGLLPLRRHAQAIDAAATMAASTPSKNRSDPDTGHRHIRRHRRPLSKQGDRNTKSRGAQKGERLSDGVDIHAATRRPVAAERNERPSTPTRLRRTAQDSIPETSDPARRHATTAAA